MRSLRPNKEHITIQQLTDDINNEMRRWLRRWWRPKPGDLYYDENYNHPLVVGATDDLSKFRGRYVPLLSSAQMMDIINSAVRPKIFKVTKNAQWYYRNRHNPAIKLRVGQWAVFRRPAHKNAWQHRVYHDRYLVNALWKATIEVLKLRTIK